MYALYEMCIKKKKEIVKIGIYGYAQALYKVTFK